MQYDNHKYSTPGKLTFCVRTLRSYFVNRLLRRECIQLRCLRGERRPRFSASITHLPDMQRDGTFYFEVELVL